MNGLVSDDMIDRVTKWLEGRKDDQGGFKINSKALDTFGYANANVTK